MKLATYIKDGRENVGIVKDNMIYTIDAVKDMFDLIENYNPAALKTANGLPLSQVQLAAPIPRPRHDIICLGMNYLEHAKESAAFRGKEYVPATHTVYFSKRVNTALGHKYIIPNHKTITQELDYETELAVIMGKTCHKVSRDDVYQYIFGYTIVNDVSARNIQKNHIQFYFGKSLDGFTPMGPWIVTADELPNPAGLKIYTKINGQLRQNSDTGQLIFDIPHIISELSQGITLAAGDIIITGTPSGVGMGFNPPQYLQSGDIIECEIEGIGKLINTVE